MRQSLLLGIGAAIGVGARYFLGSLVGRALSFPFGVLVTNAVGPFLLVTGVHVGLAGLLSSEPRVALSTGSLGGFMVLSTFNSETTRLMHEGSRALCLNIMAVAAAGCLIAGGLGLMLARVAP